MPCLLRISPSHCGCALENFDRLLGEAKARHEIRHEGQPAAEHIGAFFFAVRLVDQAEHRGRVGMVDEFVRQEGVQHHLDGWIWRRRIDQVGALDGDQVFVADGVEHAQLAHRAKPHGDEAIRSDRRHVGRRRILRAALRRLRRSGRACASSARYCRRRAGRASGRGRAAASCRCAAQDRGRRRISRSRRPRPRRHGRPTRFSSVFDPSISRRRNGATTSRCGAADRRPRPRRIR